ncbi:HAMP domain-containing sensor histidine kinase [Clostridium boliviensis]|uniref:histidine kinase n=1 Tax=Clostridium boliviensis TaxID=318465 RepID=A0ABU4GSI7_9CLOT|nr:HAMP domain-containing sensor histidine kinase [Clostridium boliviensis]MDW2800604.1 HAMP domain-containing sensor histidine kinase [Clostridium boliviensis]
MKGKTFSSLRYMQILVLLFGAFLSFAMYLIVGTLGEYLVSTKHMADDSVLKRLNKYQDSFEDYITENSISVKNVRAISRWVKGHKYIYITIYDGAEIIYESGFWNDSYSSYETAATLVENCTQQERDIKFSDGTYSVSIIDSSQIKWLDVVFYCSWIVFFIIFFIIIILYNRRIIDRIALLSKEVSLIEQGNLEQPIYHKGNDEISLLARNADNMRHSIITRYKSEKEAWEANSELITSMSHDIRTPLTSLIGYLEILDSKDYYSEEQLAKYIKSCKEKSIQLKDLSDKLFQYFLVFGKENILMEPDIFDARILLQQLLSEHVFNLNSLGFEVQTEFMDESCSIIIDIQYLNRLFDNLFSNVRKYAGHGTPVIVRGSREKNNLIISITNEIRTDLVFQESTNIGLKTCRKIAQQMNGSFEIFTTETLFTARATFPIIPAGKEPQT